MRDAPVKPSAAPSAAREAEALGHEDVAGLLRQNLEQEQHTLEEVRNATRQAAAVA